MNQENKLTEQAISSMFDEWIEKLKTSSELTRSHVDGLVSASEFVPVTYKGEPLNDVSLRKIIEVADKAGKLEEVVSAIMEESRVYFTVEADGHVAGIHHFGDGVDKFAENLIGNFLPESGTWYPTLKTNQQSDETEDKTK